jgi:hypothetical protein
MGVGVGVLVLVEVGEGVGVAVGNERLSLAAEAGVDVAVGLAVAIDLRAGIGVGLDIGFILVSGLFETGITGLVGVGDSDIPVGEVSATAAAGSAMNDCNTKIPPRPTATIAKSTPLTRRRSNR